MFTFAAFVLIFLIGWYANRKNEEDRPNYDRADPDLRLWLIALHIRQDLKLIAFGLAGILVMLGIIADRVH